MSTIQQIFVLLCCFIFVRLQTFQLISISINLIANAFIYVQHENNNSKRCVRIFNNSMEINYVLLAIGETKKVKPVCWAKEERTKNKRILLCKYCKYIWRNYKTIIFNQFNTFQLLYFAKNTIYADSQQKQSKIIGKVFIWIKNKFFELFHVS